MDIQKLFYKEEETNEKIRSEFRELNCSIDKEDQKLREKFENWFAKIPNNEKLRLRCDIQSEDNHKHWSGLFELYLHELFIQSQFKVECHKGSSKTERKPDFFISKDESEIYVEAITKSDSESDKRISNRYNVTSEFFSSLQIPKDIII